MEFADVVAALAQTATVDEAQEVIREHIGRGASRWLADTAGIAPRTARRWLSSDYPRMRSRNIVAAASALGMGPLAAPRIARAKQISVGKVRVYYKGTGRDEKTRTIGTVRVRQRSATYLSLASKDLTAGKVELAADAFSDAVICGYESGLEDTLGISDYPDGVDLDT